MLKVLRQFRNAIRYSLDGLVFLVQNEFAARIEFYGFVWCGLLFYYLDVPFTQIVMALVLFCMLISAEAINTAIEVVIDRISPEISQTGKHAKDLGSFAVMCVMIANLVYIFYIITQADFEASGARLTAHPVLFFVAVGVIFLGIYSFAKHVKKSAMRLKDSETNQ